MSGLLAELVALFAPPGCIACGRALGYAGERLCPTCVRALPWLRSGCPRCGLPKHRGQGCPAARAAFPRAWAPLAYEGVARRLVAALKFRGALTAGDLMAAHMAANLPAALRDPTSSGWGGADSAASLPAALRDPAPSGWGGADSAASLPAALRDPAPSGWGGADSAASLPAALRDPAPSGWGGADSAASLPAALRDPAPSGWGGADSAANLPAALRDPAPREWASTHAADGASGAIALVPVPAAPARRRRRGFDPAHVLTVALARRLDRPFADCLVRSDHAGRQVGAGQRERRAVGRHQIDVRGSPPRLAILVDDVHTTGATLDASARALVAHGTIVVAAISYARTL